MNKAKSTIRYSLLKREEAIIKFNERKKAFLLTKEQMIKEIEEARTIWNKTLEQLPKQEF
jgi:hypothetical protein